MAGIEVGRIRFDFSLVSQPRDQCGEAQSAFLRTYREPPLDSSFKSRIDKQSMSNRKIATTKRKRMAVCNQAL